MSEAFQYIDILILAIIAGIVLLRLRSVLGRRTGHEKTDKTSYNYETPQTSQEEKVIPIEPKTSSSKREDCLLYTSPSPRYWLQSRYAASA